MRPPLPSPRLTPAPRPSRSDDDRGTISLLAAALLLAMLLGTAASIDAGAIAAVRREAERTAALAALAAAADLPLTGLLSPAAPTSTACATAAGVVGGLTVRLAGATPTCAAGTVAVSAAAEWDTPATVRAAVADLVATLPIESPDLCVPLLAAALDPWLATLTATECAAVRDSARRLPDGLAPAVITPLVTVRVTPSPSVPLGLPGLAGRPAIDVAATARRRFKNVVVLPAMPNGVPAPIGGFDPNPVAADVRARLLPELRAAAVALRDAAAPHLPDGTSLDLSPLVEDAGDLYDPPGAAPAPSVLDVVEAAVGAGDPVVLVRLFRMPVLGIPALDVTAAYLRRLSPGRFEALPIPAEQLAAARGLFGASLVEVAA